MTVILPQFHHCDCEMCEWPNFGTLFKFPCIVRIYAWFVMHCRNHYSDSHANHVIMSIKISLKFVPNRPINHIPALVEIIVWPRPGDKPLSEPMMVSLLMDRCVTRPQWVNNAPALITMILWHGIVTKALAWQMMPQLVDENMRQKNMKSILVMFWESYLYKDFVSM